MKPKCLHILNGDSTKAIFDKTGIEGDVLVWREVFSEGSFNYHISEKAFWKHRQVELNRLYAIPFHEYQQKFIDEWNLISGDYDDIIFWFEHDFYCQINLFGAMTYYNNTDSITSDSHSLICVGKDIKYNRKATLSDYSPEEYMELMTSRIHLNQFDFSHAASLFGAFTENDPNLFYSRLEKNDTFVFHNQTKTCYRNLFKSNEAVHSWFDQIIIDEAKKNHADIQAFVRSILLKTPDYGFGDLQVMNKIKILEAYFESYTPPRLKESVLSDLPSDFIGNVDRYTWYFDQKKQKFFRK